MFMEHNEHLLNMNNVMQQQNTEAIYAMQVELNDMLEILSKVGEVLDDLFIVQRLSG